MKKLSRLNKIGQIGLVFALVLFLFSPALNLTVDAHSHQMDIVETAQDAGGFTTLLAAAEEAGLVDALKGEGPLTVFAPNDEAFNQFLEEAGLTAEELLGDPRLGNILKFHVVPGKVMSTDLEDGISAETLLSPQEIDISINDGVFLNDNIQVIAPDIEASNGVIHVIDGVLWPADIVETAVAAGFDTLVTAVERAGLVEALKGPGLFTVFAPIDEAFEALPSGVLEELLDNPEDLADVLLFHVVSGQVMAETVVGLDGQEVETLLGETIEITIDGGEVFLGQPKVTRTDIQTLNGVIHVIDLVLVP
ncbi:fasciclin domain-containing protein [Halonatronomonas betaini]|nr:fasciclin domain-containing protein [Halonatronomonas betaini]